MTFNSELFINLVFNALINGSPIPKIEKVVYTLTDENEHPFTATVQLTEAYDDPENNRAELYGEITLNKYVSRQLSVKVYLSNGAVIYSDDQEYILDDYIEILSTTVNLYVACYIEPASNPTEEPEIAKRIRLAFIGLGSLPKIGSVQLITDNHGIINANYTLQRKNNELITIIDDHFDFYDYINDVKVLGADGTLLLHDIVGEDIILPTKYKRKIRLRIEV